MKKINLILIFIFLTALTSFADTEKYYDPLDVLDQSVPPNVLFVVDTSGSMSLNTRTSYTRLYHTSYPPTMGDYTHFWAADHPNASESTGLKDWEDINSDDAQFEYFTKVNSSPGTTVPNGGSLSQSRTFTNCVVDQVEHVAIYGGLYVTRSTGSRPSSTEIPAGLSVTLTHLGSGETHTVPARSLNLRNTDFTTSKNGKNYRYYDFKYCFPLNQFTDLPTKDGWQITFTDGSSGYNYKLRKWRIYFKPYLSRMTLVKEVLHDTFQNTKNTRMALGRYKQNWYYTYSGKYDGAGDYRGGSYTWGTTENGEILVNLPADWNAVTGDGTSNDNLNDLMEWVDMEEDTSFFNSSSNPLKYRRELIAYGCTPIEKTLKYVRDNFFKSLGDPYDNCRQYHLIFLTDGYGNCGGSGNEANIIKTIRNLDIGDLDPNPEDQNSLGRFGVKVHIIGFAMAGNSGTLNSWAEAGGTGLAYTPQSSKELSEDLSAIFAKINQTLTGDTEVMNITMKQKPNTPLADIPESLLNSVITSRMSISFDSDKTNFTGDLRMYQVVDENGDFLPNGSYIELWNAANNLVERKEKIDTSSGSPVVLSGIQKAITGPVDPDWEVYFRKIITYDSSNTEINLGDYYYDTQEKKFLPNSASITYIQDNLGYDATTAIDFLNFLQTSPLGDITYSTPAVVGKPDMRYDDPTYEIFAASHATREFNKSVYVGANDCMLHNFDAYTGQERWAILFPDLLNNLKQLYETGQPDPLSPANDDYLGRKGHIYGVATSSKVMDIRTSNGWKTILIIGEGGGGSNYYCFDITYPNYPQLMWTTYNNSDYDALGETWSFPALGRAKIDTGPDTTEELFLAFTGSGYSPDSGKGKTFYTINLENGKVIYKIDKVGSTPIAGYILAAPVTYSDPNTRLATKVFFTDTKGNVYRMNVHDGSICHIFKTDRQSPIFVSPTLYADPVEAGSIWVAFGEVGTVPTTSESIRYGKLFVFKDDSCNGPYTDSDLVNIMDSTYFPGYDTPADMNTTLDGKQGFYYDLPSNESIFYHPLIMPYCFLDTDGNCQGDTYKMIMFLTYTYPAVGDVCDIGFSSAYLFGISDLLVLDLDGKLGNANDRNSTAEGTQVGEGKSGSPSKSGISGEVWINTPDGPVRIFNQKKPVENDQDFLFSINGRGGVGGWIVR